MFRYSVLCFLSVLAAPVFSASSVTVSSPDGTIAMTVNVGSSLSYSVTMDDRPVLLDSTLQMEFGDGSMFAEPLELIDRHVTRTDHYWRPVVGRKAEVRDHYNQVVLVLREAAGLRRQFSLVCRAYNDGVAFRYVFGASFGERLVVHEEHTHFTFAGNPAAWPAFLNSMTTMHERIYPEERLAHISPDNIIGPPLTIRIDDTAYCSITEAALTDWAGMYLTREANSAVWFETEAVSGGGQPYSFDQAIPAGTASLRIVIDALGSNAFDHVDIVDFKVTLEDGSAVWFSDLEPTYARQEWGRLEMDKSVDGNPLTIAGTVYPKGLGTHSNGVITFALPAGARRVSGKVGIDTEIGDRGSAKVIFHAVQLTEQHDKTVLRTRLSRRGDSPAVIATLPHPSPWRVIYLGRRAVDLANSELVLNLNEPSRIEDTTWIKAGVSSWNWLSSGERMDMELLKSFIDLSAHMNWEYALIDDGWYGGHQDDVTTAIAALDMPALVAYAAERGVKLWVWTHWQAFDRKLEEALALYQQWGIVGVKTDFMSRDDQAMVNWYHKVLEAAARHKIMINFHGSYKPTGEMRTWPNMMSTEAVFGNEQNLGSRANDPVHKTTLPFTRQLAGPMDYTPGSMLNETAETWRAGRPVRTLGTRCQEFALFIVYDSPFMCTADLPANYYGQDGLEFLKGLPATWDDTLVLDGGIGAFIVTARRSGAKWYLGGLTNWDARTVKVPLDFLESGRYWVTLYEDGPDAATHAREVTVRRVTVRAGESLTIAMAPGGGFTALVTPIP